MSFVPKSLAIISAAALIGLTSPAFAGSAFTADFSFSRTAPVSDTYASFEATAKAACRIDRLKAGGMGTKHKVENICADKLIKKAVAASQYSPLIAYHNQQTGQQLAPSQFAARN